MEQIIINHVCVLLNNEDHTYQNFRSNKTFSHKLDLAICSSNLYNYIIDFQVLKNGDMTSDHVHIIVEIQNKKKK